jgi:hypothetical protein
VTSIFHVILFGFQWKDRFLNLVCTLCFSLCAFCRFEQCSLCFCSVARSALQDSFFMPPKYRSSFHFCRSISRPSGPGATVRFILAMVSFLPRSSARAHPLVSVPRSVLDFPTVRFILAARSPYRCALVLQYRFSLASGARRPDLIFLATAGAIFPTVIFSCWICCLISRARSAERTPSFGPMAPVAGQVFVFVFWRCHRSKLVCRCGFVVPNFMRILIGGSRSCS